MDVSNAFNNAFFEAIYGTSFDNILEKAFEQTIKEELKNIDNAVKKCNLTSYEKQFLADLLTTDKYLSQEQLEANNEWIVSRINISVKFFTKSKKIKKERFEYNITIWGAVQAHIIKVSSSSFHRDCVIITHPNNINRFIWKSKNYKNSRKTCCVRP
jgi:hypothetical protein